MYQKGKSVIGKGWYFLRRYVLTLRRFDLFLQGTFLITILLETNVLLLLRRDADSYIPSAIEDWIMMSTAGGEFLLGAFIAWWGGGKRNFALSGWLAVTAGSGLLVLAFPFSDINPGDVELCDGTAVRSSMVYDSNLTARTVFLIMTAILCGLTRVSVWAHGLTYLDDHDPQNGPYFYGILISIRMSLGLSGQNWLIAASRLEDWWHAQLSISMLTLMFAVLFTLFPTTMKDFDEEVTVRTSYFASLRRVMNNKVILLQTLSISLLSSAVFGFIHYDRAYVQANFNVEAYRQDPQSSRTVSDIFRSLVIIFFVMIFRVRFSLCRADGVKANTASRVGGVTAVVVAVLLAAIAGISCDGGVITDEVYEQPACSQQCSCNSMKYGMSPVCEVDTMTTYFSPCHGGCEDYESLNGFLIFDKCTCSGSAARMVRGACSLADGGCRTAFGAYQILYTVMLAVSASSFLMQGMVILRAVQRVDKPVAMGASIGLVALLSFVIGHIVYMGISYLTCAYLNGVICVLHTDLLWSMVVTSVVLALASAALSLYTSTRRPAPEPTTEL